jgi:hypothetical protein
VRTPPSVPDAEADQCFAGPGATEVPGRTHNRFLWCLNAWLINTVYDPVGHPIGTGGFKFRAVAYGRDDGEPGVKVFMQAVPGTLQIDGETQDILDTRLSIWVSCQSSSDGCSAGGAVADNTLAGWDVDGSWHSWNLTSSDSAGIGPDLVRRHSWGLTTAAFSDLAASRPPITAVYQKIRCDSAVGGFPANRSKACVFDSVVPHIQYSTRATKDAEVARHIQCALDPNCQTWPVKPGKTVPGRYTGTHDNPGLHRITRTTPIDPATGAPYYAANSAAKDAACNRTPPYVSTGLPADKYQPPAQQCDEFPFASTIEGAGAGTDNFSVLGVAQRDNSCAGAALGNYYRDDRILLWRPGLPPEAQDEFYVEITDLPDDNPDSCDSTDDQPGPPNVAPVVDAGPDLTGAEGASLDLAGSVSDPDSAPSVHWTYTAGPDTDPGASCSFSAPESAATHVVCTDDGTFTMTLTANDGVNGAVSDSAKVLLHNVAPRVRPVGPQPNARTAATGTTGIQAPQPWQLFRVGDPITLSVRYTDPGTNDTHTCAVNWDDGTTQVQNAGGATCLATHTYTHAGMYTIAPSIADDDGGVDVDRVLVVVYDPRAGVAQGNGWLNAPGVGGFDFTAGYPTSAATVPDGAVTFALPPSANLNLRNHQHLDWLVVTPDGKMAIKGTAERIPGQNVGFVLYGYYGCPAGQTTGCQPGRHRLRMVVWDIYRYGPIPEGVPAIYDNRVGNSFDIDQAGPQDISQGIILIQHPPVQ